jgi:hypothetical protein
MIQKKILLPAKKFFKAEDENLDLRIDLEKNDSILRENDKNIILDIATLFDKERNESKKYKIYGKLKMVFRNMYSGITDYTYLKDRLFLLNDEGTDGLWAGYLPYNEFAFLRDDILREVNTPNTGNTISDFSQNITLTTGTTGHTTITAIDAPYQNWNIYLSYVYTGDTSHPIKYTLSNNTVYNFTAGDGIPFLVEEDALYYKLISPVEHGMSEGEYIILSGGTLTSSVSLNEKIFFINSVGDANYNSEKFVVNILKNQFTGTTVITDGILVLGKRCLDINNITGSTSQYYVHKHKTLTDSNEYILENAGFEKPIWEDEKKLVFENFSGQNDFLVEANRMESLLFDFKNPFVLSGITNNFGYTPTEVYVTVIFRNGNGFFNYPPKVGYNLHLHDTWIDQHFSGTTSDENSISGVTFTGNTFAVGYTGYTFTSGATLSIGTSLIGAFVEYNDIEFKERIISDALHKLTIPVNIFNHSQNSPAFYSGASSNNLAGLFYQPHYKVKLRELSPYIETSNTDDILNLPENLKYDTSTGLWKWRDLYDHGYVDSDGFGTDFPFVNNMHYVRKSINFYVRNEKEYRNKPTDLNSFDNINIDC